MIVAAWFLFVGLVIIAGFVMVGLTFRHWAQQKKNVHLENKNSDEIFNEPLSCNSSDCVDHP